MKIKVGNKVYSAEDELIMVILTKKDRVNIANMSEDATRYCAWPLETVTREEAHVWMDEGFEE